MRQAYRRLALAFHPDKAGDLADAPELFKLVGRAYEVLSDNRKRGACAAGKKIRGLAESDDAFEPDNIEWITVFNLCTVRRTRSL